MPIVGLGMDLTELDRIARALQRNEARFVRLILTPAERDLLPERPAAKAAYVAARFAAKEAAVKALGTGFAHGITPQCVEVQRNPAGAPLLRFSGPAQERAEALHVTRTHLTITHSRHDAGAVVILEQ